MRREAHLIENEFVKGEWTDELIYAILRREWESVRPGARLSSRRARSFSNSRARAGSGRIRPIRRASSATSARTPGSVSTRRPNASGGGLMS